MKNHIFLVFGESGSGKNDVIAQLCNEHGFACCKTAAQADLADFYLTDISEIENFKKNYHGNKKIHVVYLTSPERTRLTRMIKQGLTAAQAQLIIDRDRKTFVGATMLADIKFRNLYFGKCSDTIHEYVKEVLREDI